MLKCQWHINECDQQAQWVCDVPIVGASMCFCHEHKLESDGDDWYPLTLERAAQEEECERFYREVTLPVLKKAWAERDGKR